MSTRTVFVFGGASMKAENLIGQKCGKLTVVERAQNNKSRKAMWVCVCDCGKAKKNAVAGYDLKSGKVRSCGCIKSESLKGINKTHGMTKTRLWSIWSGMKQRCKRNPSYRGISVCDEWMNFENFYKWAMSNGYSDDLTIDRIDCFGNYEPSNCRWTTFKVQENNRRNNLRITVNGVTHTVSEWSDLTGIGRETIRNRVASGWPESDIFMEPNLANAYIRRNRNAK